MSTENVRLIAVLCYTLEDYQVIDTCDISCRRTV